MTTLPFDDRYQKTTPASSTDPQNVDFEIFSTDDLDVYVDGVETTDFTVAATFTDGVSSNAVVTIITPVVASPTVEIVGARDPRRDQFLVAAGAALVAAMNSDLARRTAEIMELFRDTGRAVKAPFGENLSKALPKAADRANKFAFFDGAGDLGATGDAPPTTTQQFDTRTAASSATIDPAINLIVTGGYATFGIGGATYKRVGSDPSPAIGFQSNGNTVWWELVPDADGMDVKQAGAKGDGATDDATALAAFFNAGDMSNAVTVSQGTYLTGTALVSDDNMHLLAGKGIAEDASGNMIGSVIKASGTGVADLLAIQSLTPASAGTTNLVTIKITDLGLYHRGSGVGLLIDNIIRPRIENVHIWCNAEGAIGMKLDNWAFFATLENITIQEFTDVGLLIDGNGTQHVIRACHINATDDVATAALEIRRPDFLVDGGEYQVTRTDNTGVGILVNNTDASAVRVGGRINNTLCEGGVGIKITGINTKQFYSVIINEPRWSMGQLTTGVDFDQARYCRLVNPQINNPTGGGDLAQWGALSVDCGVVCDIIAATAPVTVHASATRAWMRVTGHITIAERDTVTTDSNLEVTCEDVEDLGLVTHNGTAWDKNRQTIGNDAAISLTPPETNGLIEVSTSNAAGEYVFASFSTAVARAEAFTLGATGDVDITDGTLTGTTGGAGKIMIRADSTSGKVYIQNRLGSSRTVLVRFRPTA